MGIFVMNLSQEEVINHMVGLGIRKELAAFVVAMEGKLKANEGKSHWRTCTKVYLYNRLGEVKPNLYKAIEYGRTIHVKDEAVDIANYAMMLFDKATVEEQCISKEAESHES